MALGERQLRLYELSDEARAAVAARIEIEAAAARFVPGTESLVSAVRSFQPGYSGYRWRLANGVPGAIRDVPGTTSLEFFAPTKGRNGLGDLKDLRVADVLGLRVVAHDGRPARRALIPSREFQGARAIAVSSDDWFITTVGSDGDIVIRDALGQRKGTPFR